VVGGRWGRAGFRIQEPGVRTNSICFLFSPFCLLPTAYWILGRWGIKRQGLGGWGLGDEGLPAAGACQHRSLNLSCRPRNPTNLEENFLF
jgi:hypothetical protein